MLGVTIYGGLFTTQELVYIFVKCIRNNRSLTTHFNYVFLCLCVNTAAVISQVLFTLFLLCCGFNTSDCVMVVFSRRNYFGPLPDAYLNLLKHIPTYLKTIIHMSHLRKAAN